MSGVVKWIIEQESMEICFEQLQKTHRKIACFYHAANFRASPRLRRVSRNFRIHAYYKDCRKKFPPDELSHFLMNSNNESTMFIIWIEKLGPMSNW